MIRHTSWTPVGSTTSSFADPGPHGPLVALLTSLAEEPRRTLEVFSPTRFCLYRVNDTNTYDELTSDAEAEMEPLVLFAQYLTDESKARNDEDADLKSWLESTCGEFPSQHKPLYVACKLGVFRAVGITDYRTQRAIILSRDLREGLSRFASTLRKEVPTPMSITPLIPAHNPSRPPPEPRAKRAQRVVFVAQATGAPWRCTVEIVDDTARHLAGRTHLPDMAEPVTITWPLVTFRFHSLTDLRNAFAPHSILRYVDSQVKLAAEEMITALQQG